MSLDIMIEVRNKTDHSVILNRQFGRELINFSERGTGAVLCNILTYYGMPIALFQDMNPWEFEKVSWEEMPEFDLSSIKSGMEQAWQSSDRLLRELNRLKKRLKKEPVSSKKFRFDDPRQQRYFGGVESGPNTKNLSSDFEKDIEAMISMLERLESTDKVRFHYF